MNRPDDGVPRGLESEQILLGVLVRGLHVDEILGKLRSEHFFRRDHGLVFQAAVALAGRGVTPDAALIARDLQGKLDGGPAYLCSLADHGILLSESGITEHAWIVRETWAARSAITLLETHRKRLYQEPAAAINGMATDLSTELEQIKREALGDQDQPRHHNFDRRGPSALSTMPWRSSSSRARVTSRRRRCTASVTARPEPPPDCRRCSTMAPWSSISFGSRPLVDLAMSRKAVALLAHHVRRRRLTHPQTDLEGPCSESSSRRRSRP